MALELGGVLGSIGGGKPYGWVIDPVAGREYDLGDPPKRMVMYWSKAGGMDATFTMDGNRTIYSATSGAYYTFGPGENRGATFRTLKITGKTMPYRVCIFAIPDGYTPPPD